MEIIDNPEFLDLKEKFHIKPSSSFKFTKVRLTGPEKKVLRKGGTRIQAYADRMATSTSDEYTRFMKLLQAFNEKSISSSEAYKEFMKNCEDNAEPITERERVWFKYRAMGEEEKRLREEQRKESISSPERDEYLKSRLLP